MNLFDLRSPTVAVERRRTDLQIGDKDRDAVAREEPTAIQPPLTVWEWACALFRHPPPLIDYDAQLERRGVTTRREQRDEEPDEPPKKLTRTERLQGLADRGVDTHEEFRQER